MTWTIKSYVLIFEIQVVDPFSAEKEEHSFKNLNDSRQY